MRGTLTGNHVRVEAPARERLYDNRGYGQPAENGALELAPVEAAHLLYRGDLETVDDMALREFLSRRDLVIQFAVYVDLRERGYYLSVTPTMSDDFVVHPRGKGPWDDEIAHRIRVVEERESIAAQSLFDDADTFAIVDEGGDNNYYEISYPTFDGNDAYELPTFTGNIGTNRVLVWEPPDGLHDEGFYGQRLYGRHAESGPLQLSIVEAAYLEDSGSLTLADASSAVDYGQTIGNDRFDRRLTVSRRLREHGAIPKTGFKFGADFRIYEDFESVAAMKSGDDHSETLLQVISPDYEFTSWEISQDVRLAGAVNKQMVFALTDADEIDWCCLRWFSP
jgi:tRNA-intron endonuclease